VFDDAKDRLHFGGALCSQALPSLAGEIFPGLASIFKEAKADSDLAVAFSLATLPLERAFATRMALVEASIGDIPVVGGVAGSVLEGQPLVSRADELILFGVIVEVLSSYLTYFPRVDSYVRTYKKARSYVWGLSLAIIAIVGASLTALFFRDIAILLSRIGINLTIIGATISNIIAVGIIFLIEKLISAIRKASSKRSISLVSK